MPTQIHTPSAVVQINPSFLLAITAAATNGASVDTLGFTRAMAVFDTSPSGAGTTSDCKLQESADNSTWADVASAAFTQGTTAGGHTIQGMDINLSKRKRYLRLVHTGAGGSAAGQAEGAIHLFNGRYEAVSQSVSPVNML